MKSFECESSSEGDEPTVHPISRGIAEAPQWLRGSSNAPWGWHASVSLPTQKELNFMRKILVFGPERGQLLDRGQ